MLKWHFQKMGPLYAASEAVLASAHSVKQNIHSWLPVKSVVF